MITTEQLTEWKKRITEEKEKAEELAKEYWEAEMGAYYLHLSNVADAQLSIIERLIIQSVENNESKTNPLPIF